jgi:SAM-dependent methyltransferase
VTRDDPYRDRDLVALYDLDNPGGADHRWYAALADSLDARRIVDLGCGTGLLTRRLATAGRTVVGVDPSRTMLAWAREQEGADRVAWVEGDATAMPADGDVDLVVCTGNAIMHLDDAELATAAARSRAALRAGGVLAFETRNPAAREWERWTRAATFGERETHVGLLTEWIEVVDVTDGRVTFDAHNVFPDGEDRVYRSVLVFRDEAAVRASLEAAGFEVTVDGGWAGEPVTDAARLLVVRAVAPA